MPAPRAGGLNAPCLYRGKPMSATDAVAATGALAPISLVERIQALDVIRGLALIGIFLMNIEWFTRPITELGSGVDTRETGLSYAASWLVYTVVTGKFWTMFSLLFGMGFAVMLGRAESAGRGFVTPYLRRIIALFLFGSAHYVVLWTGDILHNYAISALLLLVIVTQSWKAWLALLLWVAVLGFGFNAESPGLALGFLASVGVAAGLIYRGGIDRGYKLFALVLVAALGVVAIAASSDGMALTAGLLGLVAILVYVLNRGALARYYQWGVGLALLPLLLALLFHGMAATVMPSLNPPPTAEQAKERAERRQERAKESAEEVRVYTQGSYLDALTFRAQAYRKELPEFAAGSLLTLPVFLIGFWFVRSGVIGNLRQNLPLFRRLWRWTLPVGLAITLTSVAMHASFPPGSGRQSSVAFARQLFELGTLPLCIGYLSALMCLLGTAWGEKLLSPLRHAGRMALSNYLGASLISTFYFSGYGLGYYGQVSRGEQVLFVAVVFALQLAFSTWWLSKFRYGPMEWLWRAATYWQWPAMRLPTAADSDETELASQPSNA